jgi:hypothetical protein
MTTVVRICTKGKIIILRINLLILWLMLVKSLSLTVLVHVTHDSCRQILVS